MAHKQHAGLTKRVSLLFLFFLTLLNILNFTGRLLPTSLGKQVQESLQFGHASLGLLSGYYFVLTYTFASLFFGFLSDRFSRSRIIFGGAFLWGLMTVLSGMAHNFGQIIAARMLFGFGQAALTPAALSLIGEIFPKERRATATAIYYSGLPLGGGLSLWVSGWLEPVLGWRGCFLAVGIATIILAIPALFIPVSRGGNELSAQRTPTARVPFSPVLLFTLLGAISIVFMGAAGNLRMVWLQNERGFSVTIGKTAGFMYMFGGLAGTLLGGWLGDAWERRRKNGRLLFAAWSQLIITPCVILSYIVSPDSALFYITWFLAMLGTTLYYGPIYAAIQGMVPENKRASAIGLLIFSVNLFGVGLGPWVAGFLGDHYSLTIGLSVASSASFLAFPFFLLAYKFAQGHIRD